MDKTPDIETVRRRELPRRPGRPLGSRHEDFLTKAVRASERTAAKARFGSISTAKKATSAIRQVVKYRGLNVEIHQRGIAIYGWKAEASNG